MNRRGKGKRTKRILTTVLALAVVFTGAPAAILQEIGFQHAGLTGVEIAEAATMAGISGSLESKKLRDYDLKSSRYMQIYYADYSTASLRSDGSCTEANSPMQVYSINTGKALNPLVFCAEHGVTQKNTAKMNARAKDGSEIAEAYESGGKGYVIDNIFRVLFYGPVTRSAGELSELGFQSGNKYYGQNAGAYTFADWTAATQCLVWECQQDFRDENFNRKANGLSYQNGWHGSSTGKISADHYANHIKGTAAMDIYNFMASEIKKSMKFDKNIAYTDKAKPAIVAIEEDAAFPYTKEISGTANGDGLEVVDEKGKAVEGISITFNKSTKKYTLTAEKESLLEKTLTVRRKGAAAARAERYTKGANSQYYKPYFWGYATNGGTVHTQGFVSGLDDPARGYLKLTKKPAATKAAAGTCEPLEPDVFPIIYMPIEKVDANTGFDGNHHTPMGDAKLDAVATLQRQIAGGAWQTIDTKQFDELGSEIVFSEQPFMEKSDLEPYLTESGALTACDHPITDSEGRITGYLHTGSKEPAKRVWDVTVNYRITITRPDGRYIDPDPYGGVREYTLRYHAETEDSCEYFCHSDEWGSVEYTLDWGATTGGGAMYNLTGKAAAEGGSIEAEQELICDLETDAEDVFRGNLLVIKSNEKENPFKDSALGGSDISKNSLWTVKLKSKGFENSEYVNLVSMTPATGTGGTNIYTVSRSPGVVNNEENPIKAGSNGQFLLRDLPYGEYIVTETSADDPMYVTEQFTVVVSEHNGNGAGARVAHESCGNVPVRGSWTGYAQSGTNQGVVVTGTGDLYNNLYQVNLRDKVKSNRIKLEKRDSETGKILRLAGTKVFIRYKGNPDYTDEENRERYGALGTVAKNTYNRFLPNAEEINSRSTNYTFELDENGCMDIPYELPYGKYEIYEWLLPKGYYVGEYSAEGVAKSHNFGFISEGQFTVDSATHGFNGTVPDYAIKDPEGNPVEYQDKASYSFENLSKMVTNRYTFTVTKQNMHTDGNFSELVTYDGNTFAADPTYDKGEHPYSVYCKVAAVSNNAVKGKISIDKEGETLAGFKEETKEGRTVFTPIYEMGAKLKDAIFGIFAAEDINLSDGSEGPKIYDSATGERISIPKKISTHLNSAAERVAAFIGKLINPKEYTAADYETGELSHNSGTELWYMLEREASEGNMKRTIYVTPEQKDTVYGYSYERSDDTYRYRYDMTVAMQNQAGGKNITEVHVSKVTSAARGYAAEIPLTEMTGSVGAKVLDPLDSYLNVPAESEGSSINPNLVSALDAYVATYTYEADGDYALNWDAEPEDFSDIGAKRFVVKNYHYYELTAGDLIDEERVVGERQNIVTPGVDANGDGDFDDEGDTAPVLETEALKETKKKIEWENEGWLLVGTPAAGDRAVFRKAQIASTAGSEEESEPEVETEPAEPMYKVAVKGYDRAITEANTTTEEKAGTVRYMSLISGSEKYAFLTSDTSGNEIFSYRLPADCREVVFTGNPETEARYVIAQKTDAETGITSYKVLLNDGLTWLDSTQTGNFEKAVVQIYEVKYTQAEGDSCGFTLNWDGFAIGSNAEAEAKAATTVITKQGAVSDEVFDVGAGYTYERADDTVTFRTVPIAAPVYFEWTDGVKADMYYKGGVACATIELPQSAVDYLCEDIVPTLSFNYTDGAGNAAYKNLDWYSGLTPENPKTEFSVIQGLPEGCSVRATRRDSIETGGEATYLIEIVTNQRSDKPLQLAFADGYVMEVYCAEAASGNGVGIIDLYSTYKTTRYTKGELVEMITTDDNGYAESKLLPLGKYIVRELKAPDGYVTDTDSYEAALSYKNQFTPLVWKGFNLRNEYFTVEIDMEKVFETAYESKNYVGAGGAVFGLYNAEILSGAGRAGLAATAPKGCLLDVITVDSDGKAKSKLRLPYGVYYLRELATKSGYILNDMPYYFVVGEDDSISSVPCAIGYDAEGKITAEDGVAFEVVLDSYGRASIIAETQNRCPMPGIIVDGIEYGLTESLEAEGVKIEANSGVSKAEIAAEDGVERSITLPNGKSLSVKVTGNTYSYTYEGVSNTFVPAVSFTGYGARYETDFTAPTGEELSVKTDTLTLTEVAPNPNRAYITITHTPVTRTVVVTPEVPAADRNGDGIIDPAAGDRAAIPAVTKEVGVIDREGRQTYTHTAEFTYTDAAGAYAVPGEITRLRNGVSAAESPGGEVLMLAGDKVSFASNTGANVSLALDENGILKCGISNTTAGAIAREDYPAAVFNGADKTSEIEFAKSVTQARQNHSAKTLQIKVNTGDDVNAGGIANEAAKPGEPYVPPIPSSPVTPEIMPVSLDEEEQIEPDEPDSPPAPAAQKVPDEPKEPETEVPKTGDDMKIYTYLFLAFWAGAGFIYSKKTRKREG